MGRLKIVFPVCCGMDVHRDFVIACIASTNSQGVTEYQSKRFSNLYGRFAQARNLAQGEPLLGCLHGVHRQVLVPRSQHP
jgi:hypothetical protein